MLSLLDETERQVSDLAPTYQEAYLKGIGPSACCAAASPVPGSTL